ncbi:MAG: LD-carboxypeptidase [Bacteroidales bacterium]|jgi:muramoyltetrapeptide carboxypeptidase|nr:LD-carboxypeptidase [Bacteroidales bacterium]
MLTPPFLQAGDTVGLIAPAYHVEPSQWEPVIPLLHAWGLQVETGYSLQLQHHVFAGNDLQRLDDLVTMMCHPQIKAVICARGGYGSGRLLADLERYSSAFDPKWLIGYSDITALASYMVNRMHWLCIHGPMPTDLAGEPSVDGYKSWDYLYNLLFGQMPVYSLPPDKLNRCGNVTAPVVGGNLSVIYSLNATPYQWQTNGCILFIEDINENLYHLDRMMTNLRISGQLANLKGLLVGAMHGMRDSEPSFGKTAYEIIARHVDDYYFPVAFGFPAGHNGINFPLVLGAHVNLNVTEQMVTFDQTIVID